MPAAYKFLICAFIFSLISGIIIIPRILVISHKHQLYDIPDSRKIHDTPIPRLGGLSFFPTITVTIALLMAIRYLLGYDVIHIPERIVLVEFLFLPIQCHFTFPGAASPTSSQTVTKKALWA